MNRGVRHGGGIIVLTFVVALGLTIAPVPQTLALLRPEWVALTLIYWCIALPLRVGVFSGWLAGLLLDIIRGGLLGQYAASYTVIAYLAVKLHKRVRNFPIWQQSLSAFLILLIGQLITLWIKGMIGEPVHPLYYWLPSLAGLLLWPPVFLLLRFVRRNFHVQ